MTVLELLDNLDSWNSDEREKHLQKLIKKLSTVSLGTLQNFQNSWDPKKPFNEFVAAQNKVIKQCIKLEMTPMGDLVRGNKGPLTIRTEL